MGPVSANFEFRGFHNKEIKLKYFVNLSELRQSELSVSN